MLGAPGSSEDSAARASQTRATQTAQGTPKAHRGAKSALEKPTVQLKRKAESMAWGLPWSACFADARDAHWLKILPPPNRVVQAGDLQRIFMEVSFPISLASRHVVSGKLTLFAGRNNTVTVILNTLPGMFNASTSYVTCISKDTELLIGELANWMIHTRDRYS